MKKLILLFCLLFTGCIDAPNHVDTSMDDTAVNIKDNPVKIISIPEDTIKHKP